MRAKAVTFNPHLKLLMTLSKLIAKQIDVEGKERMYNGRVRTWITSEWLSLLARVHWTMPRTVLPDDIDSTIRTMRDFISHPIDLEGKSAEDLLRRKRKKAIRRKRPTPQVNNSGDEDAIAADRPAKRRTTKRAAELQQFKSAAYIEDSDDAAEAGEGFYARELELQRASRAKMLALGHSAFGDDGAEAGKRKRPSTQAALEASQQSSDDEEVVGVRPRKTHRRSPHGVAEASPSASPSPKLTTGARPVPRRKVRRSPSDAGRTASISGVQTDEEAISPVLPTEESDPEARPMTLPRPSARRRIVPVSDDDD